MCSTLVRRGIDEVLWNSCAPYAFSSAFPSQLISPAVPRVGTSKQDRPQPAHPAPATSLTPTHTPTSPFSLTMPQGIHKTARRSDRSSRSSQHSNSAVSSRRAPRTIYPALLSQSERRSIESWKEAVSEQTQNVRHERQQQQPQQDAVVQAYLAAKLKLFQLALAKEREKHSQSDTSSSTSSTRS